MYKFVYWFLSLSLFIYSQNLNSIKDIQKQLNKSGLNQDKIKKIIEGKKSDSKYPNVLIEKKINSNTDNNLKDDLNNLYSREKNNSNKVYKNPLKNSKDESETKSLSTSDSNLDLRENNLIYNTIKNTSPSFFGYDPPYEWVFQSQTNFYKRL